jgi:hypothetical protein
MTTRDTPEAAHEWVSRSGRPWSLRVRSDNCAVCGCTPDCPAHLTTHDTPEAVNVEALRREIGRQLTDARVEELMRAEAIPLHGRGMSVDLQARGVAAALRALVAYDIVDAARESNP